MSRRRLPPFACRLKLRGPATRDQIVVAIGPWAWNYAKADALNRALVLPEDRDPFDFRWPVAGIDVLLLELGVFDTDRLERTALALLCHGAACVRAIRSGLFRDRREFPMVIFVREAERLVA